MEEVQEFYKHVDVLNRHGYSAYVLHHEKDYRYGWNENNTPIAYFEPDPLHSSLNKWMKLTLKKVKAKLKGKEATLPWSVLVENPNVFWVDSDMKKVPLPKVGHQDIIVIPDFLVLELIELTDEIPSVILNFTGFLTFQELTTEYSKGKKDSDIISAWEKIDAAKAIKY
jgi:hypothetical protein